MSEKTEKPTSKKIQDARKKGQVAKSKDFTQALLMVSLLGYTLANARHIGEDMMRLLLLPASYLSMTFHDALEMLLPEMAKTLALIVLPYLLIVIVVSVFSEALQSGFLFAPEALKPKLDNLNVINNLKQKFSMKNLVEFVKSLLKIAILGGVATLMIRGLLGDLVKLVHTDTDAIGDVLFLGIKQLIVYTGIAYIAIALADMVWQRHSYIKQLMMSKEEVKQEYKEMEGDPHIKSHRRHLHQEMLMSGAVDRSRQATALVTNPVHFAVAIFYESESTPLPLLTAKGEGVLAREMRRAAEEAGVPVFEQPELARGLYFRAETDHYIPSEFIEPVAILLREIRKISATQGLSRMNATPGGSP